MATKLVSIKAAVPAPRLAVDGDTTGNDDYAKARRHQAAETAQVEIRRAVESAASAAGYGVSVGEFDFRYTRKGNVKGTFTATVPGGTSDAEVQTRVIGVLNPLSQRAGASNLDVTVTDVDA